MPKAKQNARIILTMAIELFIFRPLCACIVRCTFVCSFFYCSQWKRSIKIWLEELHDERGNAKQANDQSNYRTLDIAKITIHIVQSSIEVWSTLAFGTRIISVIWFEFLRSGSVWCAPNWPTFFFFFFSFAVAAVPPCIETNVEAELDANKQQNTQIPNLWESIRCDFTVKKRRAVKGKYNLNCAAARDVPKQRKCKIDFWWFWTTRDQREEKKQAKRTETEYTQSMASVGMRRWIFRKYRA